MTNDKSKSRVTRDAFLYMDPQGDPEKFAQCESCRFFMPGAEKCAPMNGQHVLAGWSCGNYGYGTPTDSQSITKSWTAEEAGLVKYHVRCQNCRFRSGRDWCSFFDDRNKEAPQVFDCDPNINFYGCCNAMKPPLIEHKADGGAIQLQSGGEAMSPPPTRFEEALSDLGVGSKTGPDVAPGPTRFDDALSDLGGFSKGTPSATPSPAPSPAPSPESTGPSAGEIAGSAAVTAGARILGSPVDLGVGFANAVADQVRGLPDLVGSLVGAKTPEEYLKAQREILEHPAINPANVPGGSAWLEHKAAEAGLPTVSTVHPQTTLGRIGQRALETGLAFAGPGAISKIPRLEAAQALMPGSVPANLAIGAGVGAAGEIAGETIGERYRPLAETLTGAAGAGTAGLLESGLRTLPTAARREATAQEAAIRRLGESQSDPDVVAAQLRQQLVSDAGPADTQAYFRHLLDRSDHLADLDTKNARDQLVRAQAGAMPAMTPETQGTLAQQAVEETRLPALRQMMQDHQQASQELQDAMQDFGGEEALGSPEEKAGALGSYGAQMREPLQAIYDSERKRLTQLRNAIDPEGTMGINPAAISDAVSAIRKDFSPDTFGGMENKFYNRVDGWGDLIPIEDAFRLRADINSRLRNVSDQAPQETRRLLTLKTGIDKSIDDAINGVASSEQQATAPLPAGGVSLAQRLAAIGIPELGPSFAADVARAYTDSPAAFAAAKRDPLGRGILETTDAGNVGLREATISDARGASGAPPGGSTDTPGGEIGSQELAPLTPEARQQFRDWNQQYAEMGRTFRGETPGQLHAVGKILQKGGAYDSYKLRDDEVPWVIAGKTAPPEAVDRFLAAAPPEAHASLDDAFAFSLRRAAQNPDGTLNIKAYQKWLNDNQDKLIRRPDLLNRFNTAAAAQERLNSINDALAAHQAAYPLNPGWGNAGILRQFWKAGPQGRVSMQKYLDITGGRPEALQAATDYAAYDFANRVIKNGEISPSAAQAWLTQHDQALSTIPGLKDRFADAASAKQTFEDVISQHQDQRDIFTKSVAGAFLGDDPQKAISRVFTGPTRTQNATILMKLTDAYQPAQEGVQRAAIDYIRRNFTGANAGMKFGNFVRDNKDVLNILFPNRNQLFDAIANDAEQGNLLQHAKSLGDRASSSRLSPWLVAFLSERAAEYAPHLLGHIPLPGMEFIAGVAGYAGTKAIQAGREKIAVRADQIFDQMLLDPQAMKDGLQAYDALIKGKPPIVMNRFIGRLAGQAIANSQAGP